MTESHLPIFPLGTVLFPNGLLPLHIFEERYRRMLSDTRHNDPAFVVALSPGGEQGGIELAPSRVGTACHVSGISPRPDGRSDIVVSGTFRVHIGGIDWSNGYAIGEVEPLADIIDDGDQVALSYAALQARFTGYLALIERLIGEALPRLETTNNPSRGSWVIGETLTLHAGERQALLEARAIDDRLAVLDRYLRREHAVLKHTGMIGNAIDFPGRKLSLN